MKFILNLGQGFSKFCLFFFFSSGGQFVQPFCSILVEGILVNIPEKLFLKWTSGSRDVV